MILFGILLLKNCSATDLLKGITPYAVTETQSDCIPVMPTGKDSQLTIVIDNVDCLITYLSYDLGV